MKERRRADRRGAPGSRLQPGHADLQQVLLPDEKIITSAVIHWGIYWKAAAIAVAGILLMFTAAFNLGVFLTGCALLFFIVAWLTKYYLALVISDRRVLVRYGIINLDFVDMRFSQIESVEIARTIMARLLGYGSVMVAGTGQRAVIVPFVANHQQIRRMINEALLHRERREE